MSGRGVAQLDDDGGLDGLPDQTWSVLERVARAVHVKNAELQPTLDAIVSTAIDTVTCAEYAGLILILRGELVPQSTSGEPPHILDTVQRELGAGPCFDAAREQTVVSIENTVQDRRWPAFMERAAALGVASMLCVPLWVDRPRLGTLSLYSTQPSVFTEMHVGLTRLFATYAALALSEAQRTEQLQAALHNRDVIGQAKGILMERFSLSADAAFERLTVASQRSNRKLAEIARRFVETGEL